MKLVGVKRWISVLVLSLGAGGCSTEAGNPELSVDFTDAVAFLAKDPELGAVTTSSRVAARAVSELPEAAGSEDLSSALLKLKSDGSIAPAILGETPQVIGMVAGSNGKRFVWFAGFVKAAGEACLLVEVSVDNDVRCIDGGSTWTIGGSYYDGVEIPQKEASRSLNVSEASNGDVYFTANGSLDDGLTSLGGSRLAVRRVSGEIDVLGGDDVIFRQLVADSSGTFYGLTCEKGFDASTFQVAETMAYCRIDENAVVDLSGDVVSPEAITLGMLSDDRIIVTGENGELNLRIGMLGEAITVANFSKDLKSNPIGTDPGELRYISHVFETDGGKLFGVNSVGLVQIDPIISQITGLEETYVTAIDYRSGKPIAIAGCTGYEQGETPTFEPCRVQLYDPATESVTHVGIPTNLYVHSMRYLNNNEIVIAGSLQNSDFETLEFVYSKYDLTTGELTELLKTDADAGFQFIVQ